MSKELTIHRAKLEDVPRMKSILDIYAEKGELLSRSQFNFFERIRDFVVVRAGEELVGLAALHVLWSDLAEIRSLAVDPERKVQGIGRMLVDHCLADARELGVDKVFALTYQPGFFEKMGFDQVDKSQLPHKVWTVCLDCVKFPDCDEIAMMREV